MMTVQDVTQQRNITRLFHFTHSDNLPSILENGLMSRTVLDEECGDYKYNDEVRVDGHLDAICLSISHPNSKMFFKYRKSKLGDWVILQIKPSVLWEKKCAFFPTNAASNNVRFNDLDLMKGPKALNCLFADDVFGTQRVRNLPLEYPTDVQAEVLVFDRIDPSYIVHTLHPNKESYDRIKEVYPRTQQRYYANLNGRTLYSQRDFYLGLG
ncbi:DarT ssDNA thymidine ADP-ribosyltransferase family protein [Cronobacter dublinensis]